ncbi:hypothetical protein SUGI_0689050 [Cryptomeria japonica]|nr:hypothetical protein SUGI_0689050 [Cryptomeria japonica]
MASLLEPQETLQLTLRLFSEDDLDDFYGWAGDDAVTRFMTWEIFPTIESARQFLMTDNPSHVVQGRNPQLP